ncbi:hypothetical protein ABT086_40965 [Streptomyces mirabilis]
MPLIVRFVVPIGDRYNGGVTDPFAPPPETGSTAVTSERRRWTKESAGGLFAATAAFVVVQVLVFEPVSRLLPEYAHRVTTLAGILGATLAHPLATRWLKRLPSSAPPK